ncbi:hypothetical protein GCM10028798_16090 [Humibacter antri]
MTLGDMYRDARHLESVARLRRVLALRAMSAVGMTQRQIAETLGVSQSAVSQQLTSSPDLDRVPPDVLLDAAAPILKAVADANGYTRLAVFGSLARGQSRPDSDIDLLVEAPEGTSSFAFVRFKQLVERILGREIDLAPYGGLTSRLHDDIRHEAMLL